MYQFIDNLCRLLFLFKLMTRNVSTCAIDSQKIYMIWSCKTDTQSFELSLLPVFKSSNKPWCVCVFPTLLTDSTQTGQRVVGQTTALDAWNAFAGFGCHHVSPSSCRRQLNYKSFLFLIRSSDTLQVRNREILINLNLLIYLGLKMSCGAQPKSFFVSSSVMCETTLISFLCEGRQVSLFRCCMGIFISIV